MALLAYNVTGFAYNGDGVFVYQGTVDTQVQPQQGTFNLRPRRHKKKKIEEVVYVEEKEYSPLPEAVPEHIEALAKILAEQGIPITDLVDYEEDEEEALIQATKILIQ